MTDDDAAPPVGDLDATAGLRDVLRATGVSDAEIDRSERDGTLSLLAVERLVAPEPPMHDLTEVATITGMPASQIVQFWRSLGFAEPRAGDRIFTNSDADMLHTVADLIDVGVIDPALAVQMSRVIGSSLARVALSQIDAFDAAEDGGDDLDAAELDREVDEPARRAAGVVNTERARRQEAFAAHADTLLPTLPRVMDVVWRRHLQAAARQRLNQEASGTDRDQLVVGFADLVGFTALSQQITPRELAAVVDRFETIAYDTVGRLGGRVVKMIGDEVMFSVSDAAAALEIALTLSEAYAADDELSDVRVGLAAGPVLQREADLFGPVVNMASRIVGIAFPASVVVADSVHDALADDPAFSWRPIGRRRLKDIGRVSLWVAHRSTAPTPPKSPREKARGAQAERRERTVEQLASARVEHHGLDPSRP
ncbi:MAG: adenylate/guanylate cyclase domain-containing protein [Actinomycetota bacterium]|nr:adenylate/guanylate cyclase domain-containing protein [Actinomycetota bacterium]